MEALKLIEELSNAKGAPGFEDEIFAIVDKNTDLSVESDNLKNIYVNRKNEGNLVMLDSHSDEVAFIVRYIDDNGFLAFLPLGGWSDYSIPAHTVLVKGRDRYYRGLVTTKPVHFMTSDERKKTPEIVDMRIDMGGYTKEEIEKDLGISVGSPIVPDVEFSYNEDKKVMMGKAFDNRLGTAAVVTVLNKLMEMGQSQGVVGAIAAQEEVGIRGAKLTARKVKPKFSITFEGSPSDDGFVASCMSQCKMGGGPQIRHYDGSYISNDFMIKIAEKAAENIGVKIQHAVRMGSSTNAGSIHLENEGIPCLVIGIPSRYIHTHYSYASYQDFEDSVNLAIECIRLLKEEI